MKLKAKLNEPMVLNRNIKRGYYSENSLILLESKLNFELTKKTIFNH